MDVMGLHAHSLSSLQLVAAFGAAVIRVRVTLSKATQPEKGWDVLVEVTASDFTLILTLVSRVVCAGTNVAVSSRQVPRVLPVPPHGLVSVVLAALEPAATGRAWKGGIPSVSVDDAEY